MARFISPIGNPSSILDMTTGDSYHLFSSREAQTLRTLLNEMHGEIEQYIHAAKVLTETPTKTPTTS